ncbi:MAG: hypothetical protein ACLQDF_13090 [Desulfomonilia bacterium]
MGFGKVRHKPDRLPKACLCLAGIAGGHMAIPFDKECLGACKVFAHYGPLFLLSCYQLYSSRDDALTGIGKQEVNSDTIEVQGLVRALI